jgi:integrase
MTLKAATPPRRRELSVKQIEAAKPRPKAYKLPDSRGLVLVVEPNGSRLWRFRFWLHEKEGMLAVGRYPDVGLAQARERCEAARKLVAQGINPVKQAQQAKREATLRQQLSSVGSFGETCKAWRELTDGDLRPSSLRQREREIDNDLLPTLRGLLVSDITRLELSALLDKVRDRAPETARNLRTHLSAIFEYAIGKGLTSANPTPPRSYMGKRKQTNHAKLPDDQMGDFLLKIDGAEGTARMTRIAMLLTVLTASRKDEIISAEWREVDWSEKQIVIPGERMKGKLPHIIPLSTQAVALLTELRDMEPRKRVHLFPNRRDADRPMANRSLNAVLERLGFGGIATVHGFRSAFSTHMNERKEHSDAIEMALAHKRPGIKGIYDKAAHLGERRILLQRWADHLDAEREKKRPARIAEEASQ